MRIDSLQKPGPQPAGNNPTVSVVMPTYRRSYQIAQSIRTLLDGEFSDFELLVRDDGNGQDGTREAVLAAAEGDARVRYFRNPTSLRMPGNLNAAIRDARGEFIAVCHDHDLYKASFLSRMVSALHRNPSAAFVHCAIEMIDQQDRYLGQHVGNWPELSHGHDWLKFMLQRFSCPVCALTVVRRSAHEQFGLYDSQYGFISDIEMWMRLASHADVAYLSEPLIQVRDREPGHEASENPLPLMRSIARIHRRYLRVAYKFPSIIPQRVKVELRLAQAIIRDRLSLVVRTFRTTRKSNISNPTTVSKRAA